jgi:hypothetical protein
MSQAAEQGNTLRRYFTTKPLSQMHHGSSDWGGGSVNQARFCPIKVIGLSLALLMQQPAKWSITLMGQAKNGAVSRD